MRLCDDCMCVVCSKVNKCPTLKSNNNVKNRCLYCEGNFPIQKCNEFKSKKIGGKKK